MILFTIGTQKQSFKRLFNYIDSLNIKEQIIIQGGKGRFSFKNPNIEYYDFFNYDEMNQKIDEARIIITHGGGGTIFKALEKGKKVIVVPRLKEYKEHINDHQLEITKYLVDNNYVLMALTKEELINNINIIEKHKFSKYYNNNENFILKIEKEINSLLN